MRWLLALSAWLALAAAAQAYPVFPGIFGDGSPPTGPTLVNVTVNIGNLTQKGQGAVRLASVDTADPLYGYSWIGLDLWDGNSHHKPSCWVLADSTTTAGYNPATRPHWSYDGGTHALTATPVTVCDPDLLTPTPMPNGVADGLNKGDYTFSVQACDAICSPAVTLTYHMINCALSVGITYPYSAHLVNNKAGVFPTNYGTSGSIAACNNGNTSGTNRFGQVAGSRVMLSTGLDAATFDGVAYLWKQGCGTSACTSNNVPYSFGISGTTPFVDVDWADNTKPGSLESLALDTWGPVSVTGISLTTADGGGTANGVHAMWKITGVGIGCSSACVFLNQIAALNADTAKARGDGTSNGNLTGVQITSSQYVTFNTLTLQSAFQFILDGTANSSIVWNDVAGRYYSGNGVIFATCGMDFWHLTLIAPRRNSSTHVDDFQQADAYRCVHLHVHYLISAIGDGDASAQGPFQGRAGGSFGYFQGGLFHDQAIDPAGMDLTGVAAVPSPILAFRTSAPSTNVLAAYPNARVTQSCRGNKPDTCTVDDGAGGALPDIGSPTDLLEVMTQPNDDVTFDGVILATQDVNGFTYRNIGPSGAIIRHLTILKDNGPSNGEGFDNVAQGHIDMVLCTGPDAPASHSCPMLYITGGWSGPNAIFSKGSPVTHVLWGPSDWPCNDVATPSLPSFTTRTCTYDHFLALLNNKQPNYGLVNTGLDKGHTDVNGNYPATYQMLADGVAPPGKSTTTVGTTSGPINLAFAFDVPGPSGPLFVVKDIDVPLMQLGTVTFQSAVIEGALVPQNHDQTNGATYPANWSVSNVHFLGNDHAAKVAAFAPDNCTGGVDAGGCDPRNSLSQKTRAYWAGRTVSQIAHELAGLAKARVGGTLDHGGGVVDGAEDATGGFWNDGMGVALP